MENNIQIKSETARTEPASGCRFRSEQTISLFDVAAHVRECTGARVCVRVCYVFRLSPLWPEQQISEVITSWKTRRGNEENSPTYQTFVKVPTFFTPVFALFSERLRAVRTYKYFSESHVTYRCIFGGKCPQNDTISTPVVRIVI